MCTYTHSVMMKEFFQYELENYVQPAIDNYQSDPYPQHRNYCDLYDIRKYLQMRIKQLENECKEKERIMRKGE